MLFAIAFLLEFVIGGLSGITSSGVPLDWQMTDTYYLVAHFHYVPVAAPLRGHRRHLLLVPEDERPHAVGAARPWPFWLMVVGFNLTFFVQHFLGMLGMPRRVFTSPDLPHWGTLNMVSTVGAFFMGGRRWSWFGDLANFAARRGRGRQPVGRVDARVGDDLAAAARQLRRVPPIHGRRPLWDLAHPDRPTRSRRGQPAELAHTTRSGS